jgi:hypothetical protein
VFVSDVSKIVTLMSASSKFAKKSGMWVGKRGIRNSTESRCNAEERHGGMQEN